MVKPPLAGLAGVDPAGRHDRVVIPHRAVSIGDRRHSSGRLVDDRRELIDQPVALVVIEQQVENLPGAVAVLDLEHCLAEHLAFERVVAVAVHVAGPGEVQIPRQRGPLLRLGIEVVEIVFAVADIIVVDALDDRAVAVVARQVHVLPPPALRRVALVPVQVRVEVGLVRHGRWPLVVQLAAAALHLVQVAVRQAVFVEKPAIHLLEHEVQSPEVAVMLCCAGLRRLVDDPEMHPVCLGRLDAGQLEQLEADRLEHSLLAAVLEVALLDAGGEVQLVPAGVVLAAVVVARLKRVAAVEVEFPHVLAHRVAPHAAPGAVADVVVHLAVVHQRALPLVIVAAVSFIPRRVLDIGFFRDQVVHRHAGERLAVILDHLGPGLGPAAPVGHAVVAKVREIG